MFRIVSVYPEPFNKLMVEDVEFFPGIAYLILEFNLNILIVGIYFSSSFVDYIMCLKLRREKNLVGRLEEEE